MQKAPGFMYYPDKYHSHTAHLSDAAYRIYHRMLNWMWLHSPTYCSINSDPDFIAVVLCENKDRVEEALEEIQNKHMPLLKEGKGFFISAGLRKEAEGQGKRRKQAAAAAVKRWEKTKTNGGV